MCKNYDYARVDSATKSLVSADLLATVTGDPVPHNMLVGFLDVPLELKG